MGYRYSNRFGDKNQRLVARKLGLRRLNDHKRMGFLTGPACECQNLMEELLTGTMERKNI